VTHDGALGYAADAENGDLRVVDDRGREQAAELPGARDGERRSAQLLRLERARARGIGQALDLAGELVDVAPVAVAHDRDDEALVGLHGDAEVVPLEVGDLVALEARVQLGELAQARRDRLQRDRHQSSELDVAEVALLDPGDGRHLAVRASHVLGDETPHSAERLAPSLVVRSWGQALRLGRPAHVLLGYPPLRPRAVDGRKLDSELLGQAPDER